MKWPKASKRATIVFGLALGFGPLVAVYLAFGSSSGPASLGPGAGAPTTPSPPPSPGWHVDVHPHTYYPPPYLNDCATTDFSALNVPPESGAERDVGYDSETRILRYLQYLPGAEGKSVTFYVSVDDPACQTVHFIDEEIDYELKDYVDVVLVGDCASARDSLTGAASPMPNPHGAQDFIDSWCGAIPPPGPSVVPASPSA
jgi:hypothetical protein